MTDIIELLTLLSPVQAYFGILHLYHTYLCIVIAQISNDGGHDDDVAYSEVEVMQDIRHENIVQFYGATRDHRHVNLFMELMEGATHMYY